MGGAVAGVTTVALDPARAAWRWSRPTRASQRWTCAASAAGRVEGRRVAGRGRWLVRRFRTGPQSDTHRHVSSPRSPNPACRFPAPGSPVESCGLRTGFPVAASCRVETAGVDAIKIYHDLAVAVVGPAARENGGAPRRHLVEAGRFVAIDEHRLPPPSFPPSSC